MASILGTESTVIEKLCESIEGGTPSSTTDTAMILVVFASAALGVHVKKPLAPLSVAPTGALLML